MNFSVTRLLTAWGLGFIGTLLVIALLLVILFGPGWAKLLAVVLLLLDYFA